MKTTTVTRANGTTVIRSQHSFGCLGCFAVLVVVGSCINMPILIVPTIAVLGLFAWVKVKQS
jgi:hypothetical protein